MKVAYQKRFLKDLASVPPNLRPAIERFVFEELPHAESLQSTGKVEKLKGHTIYFKVRFGDFRVDLSFTDNPWETPRQCSPGRPVPADWGRLYDRTSEPGHRRSKIARLATNNRSLALVQPPDCLFS